MSFRFFPDFCPETAQRETWGITLQQAQHGLRAGVYSFLESYCDDPGCDCRRVWLTVTWQPLNAVIRHTSGPLATIGYGWEPRTFYRKWSPGDPDAGDLAGARLEPCQPQGPQAEEVLALTTAMILSPPAHQHRIRDHYAAVRQVVDGKRPQRGTGWHGQRNRKRPW